MPIVVWEEPEERPEPAAAGEPTRGLTSEEGEAYETVLQNLFQPAPVSLVWPGEPANVEAVAVPPPAQAFDDPAPLATPAAAAFWETPLGAPLPPEPSPDVLRERRKASGLSQAALAARLGVTQGCISNAERGERISRGLRERWMIETR